MRVATCLIYLLDYGTHHLGSPNLSAKLRRVTFAFSFELSWAYLNLFYVRTSFKSVTQYRTMRNSILFSI